MSFFGFITWAFKGCNTIILQKRVEFFIFALCLLLIFVVVCQKIGDERSQLPTIDQPLILIADIDK